MNKIFTTTCALLLSFTMFGQSGDVRKAADAIDEKVNKTGEMKEGWTKGGVLSINANHTSNSDWQGASEKYALSINGSLNYFAYKKWGKNLWKNDVLLAYGVLRSPSTADKFRKNDDRVIASSMYARQIKKALYYAAALDLVTQMTPGYNYGVTDNAGNFLKTSNLFTPGNIRLGAGFLWQPRTNLSVYFSPLTANIFTKLDKDFKNVDFNSVEAGETMRFGLGALLRADYFTTINEQFTYKTRFVAFTDYLNNPFTVIDLDWMNSLLFNATKYIGVKLDVNFRYYEGQVKKIQLLEMLGVGFTYKF